MVHSRALRETQVNASKSAAALLALTAMASPLAAFADRPNQAASGFQFTLGAGLVSAPSYLGDDDYQISAFPNLTISYGNTFKASLRGLEYTVFQNGTWSAGATLGYDMGREENPDKGPFTISGDPSTDLVGLGDIDGTIELGGFVEYQTGAFAAKLELSKGVDGGHDGLKGAASVKYNGQFKALNMPVRFSVGPKVTFADDAYNSTFFDVSAAQSRASGISAYDADGGLNSYGLDATFIMPLSETTSLVGLVQYDRLTGDVGESSIVQERGAQDQFTTGLFLNYKF